MANIILGLLPFLDNFAHIGGMLRGLLVVLSCLMQKRERDFGSRLDKKCYQVSHRGEFGLSFCFVVTVRVNKIDKIG